MHAASAATTEMLHAKKWNYVVLQEQSLIPSAKTSRTQTMYPAARMLVHAAVEQGASPLFFVTWAHRGGWKEQGMLTAESMQAEIDCAYADLSRELHVPMAPAGDAWMAAAKLFSFINLWKEDGSHPTEGGTYLTACVFYAALFHESPEGLEYTAGLDAHIAQKLQRLAAVTVLQYSTSGK
jgi:hypothetical protein